MYICIGLRFYEFSTTMYCIHSCLYGCVACPSIIITLLGMQIFSFLPNIWENETSASLTCRKRWLNWAVFWMRQHMTNLPTICPVKFMKGADSQRDFICQKIVILLENIQCQKFYLSIIGRILKKKSWDTSVWYQMTFFKPFLWGLKVLINLYLRIYFPALLYLLSVYLHDC